MWNAYLSIWRPSPSPGGNCTMAKASAPKARRIVLINHTSPARGDISSLRMGRFADALARYTWNAQATVLESVIERFTDMQP